MFLENQKIQVRSEAQVHRHIEPEYFLKLNYGRESQEHIYMKYFAIRTLKERGYLLEDIHCEQRFTKEQDGKNQKRIVDVCAAEEIMVEIETLRGKSSGVNVFLELDKQMINKIEIWRDNVKELWLVLPGYEVARHYEDLKGTVKRIGYCLGSDRQFRIMIPDYHSHKLVEVDFQR